MTVAGLQVGYASDRAIGQIHAIEAHFARAIPNTGSTNQYRPKLGGGSMMDLGCYPLHWARAIADAPLKSAHVQVELARSEVDESMTAALAFSNGVSAQIWTSMQVDNRFAAEIEILGQHGTIKFHNPLGLLNNSTLTKTVGHTTVVAPVSSVTTFCYQLQAIADALSTGTSLPTEGAGIIAQQEAIDTLYDRAGLSHLRETRALS